MEFDLTEPKFSPTNEMRWILSAPKDLAEAVRNALQDAGYVAFAEEKKPGEFTNQTWTHEVRANVNGNLFRAWSKKNKLRALLGLGQ